METLVDEFGTGDLTSVRRRQYYAGHCRIAATGKRAAVKRMLNKMAHRGRAGQDVAEVNGATLGAAWPESFRSPVCRKNLLVRDGAGEGHLAEARVTDGRLVLSRDPSGRPRSITDAGRIGSFASPQRSRVLLEATRDVNELPPAADMTATV